MKIQLIHCPEKQTGMAEGAWYPPLNLLALATYIQTHNNTCHVEILDGQILSMEEIAMRISADIVGFDLMHSSVDSFDTLTKKAKRIGAITIVGGHFATHLACEILSENPFVDFVCRLGGEDALLCLSRQTGNLKHPNMAYRNQNNIHVPSWKDLVPVHMKCLPFPKRDIDGIDFEQYQRNYHNETRASGLSSQMRTTNTYWSRGCPYRTSGHGCSFCSRADICLSHRSVEQIMSEGRYLRESFQIERISDFSDTFVPILHPLARHIKTHERPWKSLRIYMAVNEIRSTEDICALKTLGVDTILLGIESADEMILKMNAAPQKVHTPEKVLDVCHALADMGIRIAPAYVLGMCGETEASLHKTSQLNRLIQHTGNTEITYVNIMSPFPGTPAFDMLCKDTMTRGRFRDTYHLSTEELERAYTEQFTTVSWSMLQAARRDIANESSIPSFEFTKPT
ncbi:MAG: radical SAM protein [Candidatus Yonathbacteria bacterium]|nr:radical SAM protein [Candidatus Yonathbacteria bacterium]